MRKLCPILPRNNAGFTLAEMVIVIMVLAILVTMSTPAIYQFLRQRDRQNEENVQLEIRKALQAYLADKNVLPSADTWSTDLAGYTNLSSDQIEKDTWNRARSYIMYKEPYRNLQGTNVEIYYATVLSAGPNGKADAIAGIAVDNDKFAAEDSSDWWSKSANQVDAFSKLQTGGDDIMTRFTDYPEKLERYNITLQRLDRISTAIEAYAKNGYANKVVFCGGLTRDPNTGLTNDASCDNGAPERAIYYPKSVQTRANADPADNATYTDAQGNLTTSTQVSNYDDDTQRRADMVKLMRILGLPDDFCCSALSVGGDGKPKPFYYFSNPRPRAPLSGCGARPGAADMKLPARITTTNDDAPSLPGVTPTCG